MAETRGGGDVRTVRGRRDLGKMRRQDASAPRSHHPSRFYTPVQQLILPTGEMLQEVDEGHGRVGGGFRG